MKKVHLTILAVALFVLSGCSREERVLSRQWIFFDTVINFKIYGNPDEATAEKIFSTVKEEFARWDSLLDNYNPKSAVEYVNTADGETTKVSPEFGKFLAQCEKFEKFTNGALCPNIGHITKLWGISQGKKWVPPQKSIDSALALTRGGHFSVVDDTLVIHSGDLEIDPGAFGKGYVVDRVYEKVYPMCAEDKHITGFLIDAGRNIRGWHRKRSFNIGIANPRGEGIVGVIKLPSGIACASAGDYERYFIKDGVRYHHIFDPWTGYPARGANASTVIAADALTADALSTAAIILGKKVKNYIDRPDIEVIIFKANDDSSLSYSIIGSGRYEVSLE